MIFNISTNVRFRCGYIAENDFDPELWSTDILVMIDVINYLASFFAFEIEGENRKKAVMWITRLFGCFKYVCEKELDSCSKFYHKNYAIILNNVILCIYNLLTLFPLEV